MGEYIPIVARSGIRKPAAQMLLNAVSQPIHAILGARDDPAKGVTLLGAGASIQAFRQEEIARQKPAHLAAMSLGDRVRRQRDDRMRVDAQVFAKKCAHRALYV